LEDLVLARLQPNVSALVPADSAQTRQVVHATVDLPGPAYLRIDKNEHPDILGLAGRFGFDRPELVRAGGRLLFLTTGSITHEALHASELLASRGISASVAIQAHLSFTARIPLRQLLARYQTVITVEEGWATGGLGSLAAETIAQHGLACRLVMRGITVPFLEATGSVDYLRRQHGLDSGSLAALAHEMVDRRAAA
jgi:transketolase